MGGAHKLLRAAIDMCTCTAALGLASAMAGTGDVDCLRVFRELRFAECKINPIYEIIIVLNLMLAMPLYCIYDQMEDRRRHVWLTPRH